MALGNPEPCTTHGAAKVNQKYQLFGKTCVRYFCQACERDKKWEEEKSEKARRFQAQQERVNARLENAMIAPRFTKKTLANWVPESKVQQEALMKAKVFIQNHRQATGLIMVGKPGTGKNHLACGIVQECIRHHDMTALVTTAFKIVRRIKESWATNEESKTLSFFRDIDLLVIDEIGVQFNSDTEWLYITEIINDRYEWFKPTILISNLTIKRLGEVVGERVLDRFREGGHVLTFDWESYRGKYHAHG